jgi:hypothetical protein
VSLLQKIRSWWRHGDVDQLDAAGVPSRRRSGAQGSTFKAASGGAIDYGALPREKDERPK